MPTPSPAAGSRHSRRVPATQTQVGGASQFAKLAPLPLCLLWHTERAATALACAEESAQASA